LRKKLIDVENEKLDAISAAYEEVSLNNMYSVLHVIETMV